MKQIFKRMLALGLVLALTVSSVFAGTYTADTATEFYEMLGQAWENQEETTTIHYDGKSSDLTGDYLTLAQFQRSLAAYCADASNYDYVALNLNDGNFTNLGDSYVFSAMEFLNTVEQLAWVEEQVEEIADSLDLDDADDFTKIKTVYAYMTSSFVYDQSLTRFSAYDLLADGTAVCQGYALLTCRLLEAVDVNARMITGFSQSQPHAWNQVEWEGQWYSLDTTWDASGEVGTPGSWNFFMKGVSDFSGHTLVDQFWDEGYTDDHPQAMDGYPLETLTITDGDGDIVAGLVVRLGVPVQMGVTMPGGAADDSLVWSTDDPEILEVTADGQITAVGIGTTWLNVDSLDNPDWVGGKISVVTVDMTTLSDWSKDIVTDYYLNQMLPSTQCHDYQDAITRLDLARLVDQMVYKTSGYVLVDTATNPFDDVDEITVDTYDFYAVLRCYLSGIMEGTSDTTFDPDGLVTREQAAAVLVRAQAYVQGEDYTIQGSPVFGDSEDISSWAVDTVASAQEQGLLQGNDDGTFNPQGQMTREQMIVALSRVYGQFVA